MKKIPQTVKDLKKALKNFDNPLPLIYAKDDEGNDYNFVYFTATQMYFNPGTKEISGDKKNSGFIKVVCIN